MGRALRHGKQAVLDWESEATDPVHAALRGKPLDKGAFTDAENRVRNALHHVDKTMRATSKPTSRRLRAGCWCAPARMRISSG